MQFKHPEVLYALFLLLIPILVHLFQLRKFKKEIFTNVAFLKNISIQTRKSNTIKKWLILLTRIAAIACIVLAFAQPFFTQSESATREKETIIYLDNSFSMQAKGPSGQLLKTAAQDLITNIPEEETITLITNTDTYRNTTIKNLRNELLQLPYVANQLSEDAVTLRAQKEFTNSPSTDKRLILISDFQDKGLPVGTSIEGIEKNYVQLSPVVANNVSIDSLYISGRKTSSLELTVLLSTLENKEVNTSVSLYNGDQLLAKGTAAFDTELTTTVIFDVENTEAIEGRVVIEDPLLSFDNTMHFSINKTLPIKVLAINGGNSSYLKRIFTAPEFEFTSVPVTNLDFSSIPDYNFIVVNEVSNVSPALVGALDTFAKAGNIISLVLNSKDDVSSLNQVLTGLGNFQTTGITDSKRLVTTINYNHPIYNNVFDNQTNNFQYPSVSTSINIVGGDPVLTYEDGSSFITESNGVYIISGTIDIGNSNFKNSPLIVPTFYNMSRQSLKLPQLYFYTGQDVSYDIPAVIQEDDILSLKDISNDQNTLIPLQRSLGSKVRINTSQEVTQAGIYDIILTEKMIQQVSYNYSRDESVLRYAKLDTGKEITYTNSVETLFDEFKIADNVQSLWKWFIIFALLFLLMEILILKFYK